MNEFSQVFSDRASEEWGMPKGYFCFLGKLKA
jgi:hypothetical protein